MLPGSRRSSRYPISAKMPLGTTAGAGCSSSTRTAWACRTSFRSCKAMTADVSRVIKQARPYVSGGSPGTPPARVASRHPRHHRPRSRRQSWAGLADPAALSTPIGPPGSAPPAGAQPFWRLPLAPAGSPRRDTPSSCPPLQDAIRHIWRSTRITIEPRSDARRSDGSHSPTRRDPSSSRRAILRSRPPA